ncbi:MAG: DUF1398 family protein [Leptospiraceae bacterium]|nr:DUF1398 family protein [Leptospiraceae bacterium]
MNTNKIKETINLTLEGKMTFPLVVGTLIGEGVESYHVDYVRSENTYYLPNGESHREAIPHKFSNPAKEFSMDKVKATIKKIQAGEINYNTFSEEIIQAGCCFYIAYLSGRRVIYFGREGEFHIEHFPGAK